MKLRSCSIGDYMSVPPRNDLDEGTPSIPGRRPPREVDEDPREAVVDPLIAGFFERWY